ncbi:MAG: hypothetical protein ACREQ4_18170 [Candidatus Binataceae bacterium]
MYRQDRTALTNRAAIAQGVRKLAPALLMLLGASLLGCSNAALDAGQRDIAAHQYDAAHQQFLTAAQSRHLSEWQRCKVQDGLCLTEFKIGTPAYSLAAQHQVCAAALDNHGSRSAPIFAQINAEERAKDASEVGAALQDHDLARAETAMIDYQSHPGADARLTERWTRRVWNLVNRPERHPRHTISPAISTLSRQYPRVRTMGPGAFRHWILKNTTVAGEPMVSDMRIGRGAVDLWVPDDQAHTVALNLNRFVRVNDALVARCRCDGHTNVAIEGKRLPAYLMRLDPEIRQSEVVILPRPE